MKKTRRDFIKKTALATTGIAAGVGCSTAKSYNRIIGANDTIHVGVAGINSRGNALRNTVTKLANTNVHALCDVDSKVLEKRIGQHAESVGNTPKGYKDIRKMIEDKNIDAVFIATPDHSHAPFAIHAMQGGKHVYCEKPCSQNPAEGDLLMAAQVKYGKQLQIGNQQRSAPTSQSAMRDIADGVIGEVYEAKCWYANNRGTIGKGKPAAVPDHIDWDLWQGPAPRRPYMDNIVHYNWHWFRHWGTGEICNNGLHEMDICRWALGTENPSKVTSQGGRFHFTDDDWEFFDTQIARFEFEDGKSLTWEGRSCNGRKQYERGRGVMIYGTEGSIMLDRNNYILYDRGGKEVKNESEKVASATTGLVGAGGLTDYHIQNFFQSIRVGEALNSSIQIVNASNHLCHLGNMAQDEGGTIDVDPKTGKVVGNMNAMKAWSREYEAGWEPDIS